MAKALMLVSHPKTFVCGFLGPARSLYDTSKKLNGRSTTSTYVTDAATSIVSFCVQVHMLLIMLFNFITKCTAKSFFFQNFGFLQPLPLTFPLMIMRTSE